MLFSNSEGENHFVEQRFPPLGNTAPSRNAALRDNEERSLL